jgi:hypothetical protein
MLREETTINSSVPGPRNRHAKLILGLCNQGHRSSAEQWWCPLTATMKLSRNLAWTLLLASPSAATDSLLTPDKLEADIRTEE